jgi:hypothetical protein
MLKNVLNTMLVTLALILAMPVHADKASLKTNISTAREKLKAIVGGGDVASNKKEIAELTAKVDAEADSVAGLKNVWAEFKETRDKMIIPAYESGNADAMAKAKTLALGVQAERFQKMMDLLK